VKTHDQIENACIAEKLQQNVPPEETDSLSGVKSQANTTNWLADLEQTLQLGDQFVGFAVGVIDLARMEALLAIKTLPKLLMLWLIMIPIILLTWCAFSALAAWSVYAASDEIGLGMLMLFMLQVLLLLSCRWLFVKYRKRMTLPYTRAQIEGFMRSNSDGFSNRGETKE